MTKKQISRCHLFYDTTDKSFEKVMTILLKCSIFDVNKYRRIHISSKDPAYNPFYRSWKEMAAVHALRVCQTMIPMSNSIAKFTLFLYLNQHTQKRKKLTLNEYILI